MLLAGLCSMAGLVEADVLAAWDTAGCNACLTPVWTNNYTAQNVTSNTALLTGSAPYGYQNRINTYAVEGQSFTAINTNVYVQFSLSAKDGYELAVTNLDLYVARASTGARSFALRSSQDGFSSNLVEWGVADDSNTLPVLLGQPLAITNASVAFRLYMWNATGVQKGYVYDPGAADSITVSGSVLTNSNAFSVSDPLGINIDDVPAMNTLENVAWAKRGYLDVTSGPFYADPTGASDSTEAIQKAVIFARHHKLVAFFPAGTYVVTNTITCMAGWHEQRDPSNPYLPYVEQWPCVLMGDTSTTNRPKIVLANNAPGFDAGALKPVVYFHSRKWNRVGQVDGKPLELDGSDGFLQCIKGLEIRTGTGNPRAVALFMDAAEGSTIEDCTLNAGEGFAGLERSPGSGGAVFNVEFVGGEYGALMNGARPTSTLVGCRFSGQRKVAIYYEQRGALTAVGCDISVSNAVQALISDGRRNGGVSLIDCVIRYESPSSDNVPFKLGTSFFAKNTYVRHAAKLTEGTSPLQDEWVRIDQLAVSHNYEWNTASIFLKTNQVPALYVVDAATAPTNDVVRQHILWDEEAYPTFNKPGAVSVKDPPYNAVGDGVADDYAALQQAIAGNETVFLPKGAYATSKQLVLRPDTKLFGVAPSYSMIVPIEAPGGDFMDPCNPNPVLLTADDANADTELGFFSVFMPGRRVHAVYMIDWRCGGRSSMRDVHPTFEYTELDWTPLDRGIYPWSNWSWTDMGDLAMTEMPAGVVHGDMAGFAPDTTDGNRRNWAMRQVHGNGGGGWYPVYTECTHYQGKGYRQILVENAKGPFAVYHAQLQYSRGDAEVEIVNSSNVSFYGIKKELDSPTLIARNATNVLFSGMGGPGLGSVAGRGHFRLFDSDNITLANLFPDPRVQPSGIPSDSVPLIYVYTNGVEVFKTDPLERPTLFFWGDYDEALLDSTVYSANREETLITWNFVGCNAVSNHVWSNGYAAAGIDSAASAVTGNGYDRGDGNAGYINRDDAYGVDGQAFTELNTNVYVQFDGVAEADVEIRVNRLDMRIWRTANGARSFALRSSADGFATNLAEWGVPFDDNLGGAMDLENAPVGITSSNLSFRLYMWNGTGTQNAYLRTPAQGESIVLYGSTTAPWIPGDLDADSMPDWWELQQVGSKTAFAAGEDADGDGAGNLNEYVAGTNPLDPASRFALDLPPYPAGPSGFAFSWDTVVDRCYFVYSTTNLAAWDSVPLWSVAGDGLPKSYTNQPDATPHRCFTVKVSL